MPLSCREYNRFGAQLGVALSCFARNRRLAITHLDYDPRAFFSSEHPASRTVTPIDQSSYLTTGQINTYIGRPCCSIFPPPTR